MPETDEIRVARAFFAQFEVDLAMAYEMHLADDAVHINSGMVTMDKAATMASFFGPHADLGFKTIRAEILRMAQSGKTVFTERVDYHRDDAGRDVLVVNVCGSMDIEDGKIVRLAEYFDSAPVNAYFASRTNVSGQVLS